jgi:hypothetical protein
MEVSSSSKFSIVFESGRGGVCELLSFHLVYSRFFHCAGLPDVSR